ncbi:TPA: hypothetical protein ACGQ50_000881 [Enterobacter cloacae]
MSVIDAHRGMTSLEIDFATSNVDEESSYSVSGSLDGEQLVEWLNDLTLNACAQDGLSGLYNRQDTPRSIINALRFAQFDVVLPPEWEQMDDPVPEEDNEGGTDAPPVVM